jgi:hypothetical protein
VNFYLPKAESTFVKELESEITILNKMLLLAIGLIIPDRATCAEEWTEDYWMASLRRQVREESDR